MEQQQKKEELERRLHDVQSKLGNDSTKTGEKKKGAKHTAKNEHNSSTNSKGRNSSSSSGSDSSDSSGSSSDDSDSESNSDGEQKKLNNSNMQSSAKKINQPLLPGSVAPGSSVLNNSGHSSINNIKNSSNSQNKGPSAISTKISNNNSAASQSNPLVSGSALHQSHSQQNNIKVRNDLMPGSTSAISGNTKALPSGSVPSSTKQLTPSNPYQGNNGLQTGTANKGPTSNQKEDSPSSIDANSSSHQTKTKAMLKGKLLFHISYRMSQLPKS